MPSGPPFQVMAPSGTATAVPLGPHQLSRQLLVEFHDRRLGVIEGRRGAVDVRAGHGVRAVAQLARISHRG